MNLARVDLQSSLSLEVRPNRPDETICGNVHVKATGSNLTMEGRGVAGVILAQALSSFVDRPVVDKIGFAGRFEIHLEFTREEASSADASSPSIFDALEQQLGLRLIAHRAPSNTRLWSTWRSYPVRNNDGYGLPRYSEFGSIGDRIVFAFE